MRYTSLLHPMFLQSRFLPSVRRLAATVFMLLSVGGSADAQSSPAPDSPWSRPAHDLLTKALDKAGSPSTVTIDVENRSALSSSDLQSIRQAFDNELRAAKVKVVRMESALSEMKFILSRNARGLLWIAQVKQGTSEQVSMLEFVDPSNARSASPALFQLQRSLLLSRTSPMLDVAVGDNYLLVLGSEQLSLYPRDSPGASPMASVFISHLNIWPRDLRGRLFTSGDTFAAYLPGVRCRGTVRPALMAQCSESDDPWPLLPGDPSASAFFSSGRNHYSGVLAGNLSAASVPAFFSATRLGDSDGAVWLFAGTDGFTRLYIRIEKSPQPVRTVASLGSDMAALQTNCGSRWQLLVTGDGDESSPDTLQAFEIASEIKDRAAAVVSDKLSFSGPVTALWSAPDPSRAIAITRNPGKDTYEAHSVSLTCGR
ncbi:MAG TPA: hypothetical protein VMZ25_08400 [Terriglobales bacterium]|nr:hypothetical protein [Terriglobales bacterium]